MLFYAVHFFIDKKLLAIKCNGPRLPTRRCVVSVLAKRKAALRTSGNSKTFKLHTDTLESQPLSYLVRRLNTIGRPRELITLHHTILF